MEKLTKKYKVVAKDGKLLWPVEDKGFVNEVYPGNGTVYFESDSFEEAQQFVNNNNLVYEIEPSEEE